MNPESAFQQVLSTHGTALKRLCRGYERDPTLRQELEQELLLALWMALPRFEGGCSERTFVFRVAHNTAIRHVHRAARRPKASVLTEQALRVDPGQADRLDQSARVEALYSAVQGLRPPERALVLLHLEGFSNLEIAEVLGLSASNVSTKLSRVRTELSRRIKGGA